MLYFILLLFQTAIVDNCWEYHHTYNRVLLVCNLRLSVWNRCISFHITWIFSDGIRSKKASRAGVSHLWPVAVWIEETQVILFKMLHVIWYIYMYNLWTHTVIIVQTLYMITYIFSFFFFSDTNTTHASYLFESNMLHNSNVYYIQYPRNGRPGTPTMTLETSFSNYLDPATFLRSRMAQYMSLCLRSQTIDIFAKST